VKPWRSVEGQPLDEWHSVPSGVDSHANRYSGFLEGLQGYNNVGREGAAAP
jgi:hypothetical protein